MCTAKSLSVVTYSLQPHGFWPAGLLSPWNLQATRIPECPFPPGISPNQGLNPRLLMSPELAVSLALALTWEAPLPLKAATESGLSPWAAATYPVKTPTQANGFQDEMGGGAGGLETLDMKKVHPEVLLEAGDRMKPHNPPKGVPVGNLHYSSPGIPSPSLGRTSNIPSGLRQPRTSAGVSRI